MNEQSSVVQCAEATKTWSVLLPELIDIIAQFLPTTSDMYQLLISLPAKYLSEALSALQQLMLIQTSHDIKFSNALYCPIEMKKDLWPQLPITQTTINSNGLQAIEKSITLYSSIMLEPSHDLILPQKSTAKISYCVTSLDSLTKVLSVQNASSLTLDLNGILKSVKRQQMIELWQGVAALPNLESLTLKASLRTIRQFPGFIKLLKSSTSLIRLHLACEYRMHESDQSLNDRNFIEDLFILSKNLYTLTLQNLTLPALHMNDVFEDCPEWLLDKEPELLKFKFGKISGVILSTQNIAKVIENLSSLDLCEVGLSWVGLERRMTTSNVKLLQVLTQMPSLRKLKISGFVLDEKCCQLLAGIMPQLDVCWLFHNRVDDNCGCILAQALTRCTHLQLFSLIHQQLSDRTASSIANAIAHGSVLRSLDLSSNKIGDSGAVALSNVMFFLDSINLSRNEIGCEGAMAIGKIISHANHTSITLNWNPLTKHGISAIMSGLTQCSRRLRSVNLTITEAMDERLPLQSKRWCNDFQRQLASFPNYRL